MTIYELVKERTEMAAMYAEDGAYRTALNLLEEITKRVREHVDFLEEEGL